MPRVAITLGPCADVSRLIEAAQAADAAGADGVGTWDHVQSETDELAISCGWAVLGAIAMVTTRTRITPMVVDMLNHPVSALAKETAMLALLSGGRFELGIGAGVWREEQLAWGRDLPPGPERVARLETVVATLRRLWAGEAVTIDEQSIRLDGARSKPGPPAPPRVIVGAGTPRLVRNAVRYADGINVVSYGDTRAEDALVALARDEIAASGRAVELSLLATTDAFSPDPGGCLERWREAGIDRVFVNLMGPYEELDEALALAERAASG